jgi:hypothetical protein
LSKELLFNTDVNYPGGLPVHNISRILVTFFIMTAIYPHSALADPSYWGFTGLIMHPTAYTQPEDSFALGASFRDRDDTTLYAGSITAGLGNWFEVSGQMMDGEDSERGFNVGGKVKILDEEDTFFATLSAGGWYADTGVNQDIHLYGVFSKTWGDQAGEFVLGQERTYPVTVSLGLLGSDGDLYDDIELDLFGGFELHLNDLFSLTAEYSEPFDSALGVRYNDFTGLWGAYAGLSDGDLIAGAHYNLR